MFVITASPMGRPLYLVIDPNGVMTWASNKDNATVYFRRWDASAAYKRCMNRRDWPEWARFATIIPAEEAA